MRDDLTPTQEVHTASPGRSTGPGSRPRLIIVSPLELAQEIGLGAEPITLGRAPADPQGRLPHPTVSREHLRVRLDEAGDLLVEDLGSRNGSFVDGQPLGRRTIVAAGGVLRFGDVVAVYEREMPVEAPEIEGLPGRAVAMTRLRAAVQRAAESNAPVLIGGETGTGKERIARAIHSLSGRSGAFVAVNCAELSGELFAGALFGHERGAFTGADAARLGVIRSAQGGTLLLDEVGELPLELQAKLLRVLEEQEVLPVGASRPTKVDVRFLASTHRDLLQAVQAGTFRRDLYARLGLHEIYAPNLAERRVDRLEWLARFAQSPEDGPHPPGMALDGAATEWLLLRPLPGNLRELKALALRARSSDPSRRWSRRALETLLPDPPAATPAGATGPAAAPSPKLEKPPVPDRAELERLLAQHGSVRGVAKALSRDRRQIYRWIEAHGLKRPAE